MAFRVNWQEQAKNDLFSIREYLRVSSPQYARNLVEKVRYSAQALKHFPYKGRYVPEFDREDVREIFVDSYRIIYVTHGQTVSILAVIHMARDLSRIYIKFD